MFRRTRQGIRTRLRPAELTALRDTLTAVATLLDAGMPSREANDDELAAIVGLRSQAPETPEDPALARLFPAAYADPEAAAEFRRYTQDDLYAEKRGRLAAVLASLDEVGTKGDLVLTVEQAQQWLGALNDVRLVLGERLGIEHDDYEIPSGSEEIEQLYGIYQWCSLMQETLVEALARW